MKKIILTICLLLGITFMVQAQNRKINFIEKPWNEIVAIAKTQDRMIFLDAYTTWCGPCKWMAANMFTNDTIADLYNNRFVCAHFDMEKGEGVKLAAQYKVKAYPTLLFIDGNGEVVHKRVGAPQKVSDYIETATIALTPGEGVTALQKQYESGKREGPFMLKYLDRLQGAYIPTQDPLEAYFASLSEADFLQPVNWQIIYQFANDINSRGFRILQARQEDFEKQYSADSVNQKLFNVYLQSLASMPRSRSFTETAYLKAKQQIRESGYRDTAKVFFTADLYLFQMRGDVEKFLKLADNELERHYRSDASFMFQMAESFLQIAEDSAYLHKACSWAREVISLQPAAANYDLLARLLYKTGRREEAIKQAETAIEMAKKEKVATAVFEGNLKKFKENR